MEDGSGSECTGRMAKAKDDESPSGSSASSDKKLTSKEKSLHSLLSLGNLAQNRSFGKESSEGIAAANKSEHLPPDLSASGETCAVRGPTDIINVDDADMRKVNSSADREKLDNNTTNNCGSDWIFSRLDNRDNYPGLAEFGSALASIPTDEKTAYIQARSSACFAILNHESDPIKFLLFAKKNATAAAKRFVSYWQWRHRVFGKERYMLPLNATGCGAIPPDDLDLYESGYYRILPCDKRGRQVLYFDPSKANKDGPCRDRMDFYFCSLLMRNELSMIDECPILFPVNSEVLQRTVRGVIRGRILKEALPIRVHLHIVKLIKEEDDLDFVQKFLPTITHTYQCKYTIHGGENRESILESLLSHGFNLESLPEEFNGCLTDTSIDCYDESSDPLFHKLSPRVFKKKSNSNSKPRSKNAEASRIKRERARQYERDLYAKKEELLAEQDRLTTEHQRLSQLLVQAHLKLPSQSSFAPQIAPTDLATAQPFQLQPPTLGTYVDEVQWQESILLARQQHQRNQHQPRSNAPISVAMPSRMPSYAHQPSYAGYAHQPSSASTFLAGDVMATHMTPLQELIVMARHQQEARQDSANIQYEEWLRLELLRRHHGP